MLKYNLMKHVSLAVPSPCKEQWENFSPTVYGAFCNSCAKEVTDFTKMTENEIVEFLKTKPSNSCGRFRSTQLKSYAFETTHVTPIRPNFAFLKAGILGAVLLASKPALAQAYIQRNPTERTEKKIDALPIKTATADSITIKGFVLFKDDESPLPGVNVVRQGTAEGITTDIDGRFVLDHLHDGDVLLFSFIGLATEEYKIKKDSNPIEIKMKMTAEIMLGELSVNEIYTPKESMLKKAWWKVKNLF